MSEGEWKLSSRNWKSLKTPPDQMIFQPEKMNSQRSSMNGSIEKSYCGSKGPRQIGWNAETKIQPFSEWGQQKRRDKKFVDMLEEDGSIVSESGSILNEFTSHLNSLFLHPQVHWNLLMGLIQPKVSKVMNSMQMEPLTEEEVTKALIQMHPTKRQVRMVTQHYSIKGFGVS